MSFSILGLSKDLLKAVEYAGYQKPTDIQAQVIPFILDGKNVIAEAKTGTGKTASFVLPILQLLQDCPDQERKTIKALILMPTRELAGQVSSVIKIYGRHLTKPKKTALIVGGSNIDVQSRALIHGVDIVVATPGRLLDVAQRQRVDFNFLRFLVIDEADKMFDLGFSKEIESVLNLLPKKRQNLLFSATMSDKVQALAQSFMPEAVNIKIEDTVLTVDHICQRAIEVNRFNRGPLLRHLIQVEGWQHVLVFVAKARDSDVMAAKLNKLNIDAEAFHGGLTQAQRTQVLGDFKKKKFNVLVATDLAARGIDINKLPYVVNYDLPRSPDDYIHRIGRTARAGEPGEAITFIGHEDQAHFALIEKRTQMRLKRESINGFELKGDPLLKAKGKPPVKGLRMSKKDKARVAAAKEERHRERDIKRSGREKV
ncbi:MAG: DEAD/DEAH box helicase [Candidatus Omnitrophica bacterium]|nr:DEAD/DEAH box helicase [Candidatus Omnitrophota bacterium]